MIYKLNENISKTFGFEIANPIKTKICYWDIGTAFWKPTYNSKIISKKICKPFNNTNLYICGENYSLNQGWMEGALETSERILERLK